MLQVHIRLLMVYALSQQADFGLDATIDTIACLFDDLRDTEAIFGYHVDPLACVVTPPHNTRSKTKFWFIGLNSLAEDGEDFRVIPIDWSNGTNVNPAGRRVLIRAFVQENHEIIFTLSTDAPNTLVQPTVIYHSITSSPQVRLIAAVAAQPNTSGQVILSSLHFPRKTLPAVFEYENVLMIYIRVAEEYLLTLKSYASQLTNRTDELDVFNKYTEFITAKHQLMAVENRILVGSRIEDALAVPPLQHIVERIGSILFNGFISTRLYWCISAIFALAISTLCICYF